MARKRMIDPSIWADDGFGTLSSDAKVMFIGLFSNADDEGRLPGEPKYLASIIFPYRGITTPKAQKILHEIEEKMKSVTFYRVELKSYIQFENFLKYQTLNKPTKSKYPQPQITELSTGVLRETKGSTPVGLPPKRIEENLGNEERVKLVAPSNPDFAQNAFALAEKLSSKRIDFERSERRLK